MIALITPYNPRRQNRRGFVVAPLLYMLGLIGVIGGVIYSNNMQSIRSVMTVQNSLSVRSDLLAASTTLSAEAVFSTDNQTLCPPRSTHQTSGAPCATAPVALTRLSDLGTDPHLPANAASASSSGAPVEVGIFPAGAGIKQLDPYGHYYIYCRWENTRSTPAAPAFIILSAGPDGNLQTTCGSSTPQGDDSLTMLTVGEAINRAALWQSDASNNVSYGSTGSKVTIDSNGNLTAAGNITAGGALVGQSASITNAITASSLTASGNITGGTGNFGDISGSSLEISGAATITGTTTLGVLNAQASTLDSLTVNNSATMNGGQSVNGGDLILANGYSFAQIDSSGNSRRLIALSPENDILLGGHNGTGNIYFLTNNSTVGYVDVEGDLAMTGNIVGLNGTFSGNSTATNYTATSTVTGVTGDFQNLTATNSLTAGNTTINGNLTATGTITAASFNGTMTFGGSNGVAISGIVPLANGGTGASNASAALNNLGVTSGGVFNTGLLSAGLINGNYLTSGTVTSTQLNQTGVAAGNCPSPTVGQDGRITACGTSVTVSAAGSTGDIQFNNAGNFAASDGLFWNNTNGYLGIGTTSPAGILDVEGGKAVVSASGTNINLVAQSGGTGNSNGGNIDITPGAGSGSGYAGAILIGSSCPSQSWLAYGLCATGDILAVKGFVTADYQPYGWGQSSSQITGYGENSTNDEIRFVTDNVERARFDGSGHFGIATTGPVNALDVNGIADVRLWMAIGGTTQAETAASNPVLSVYGNLDITNGSSLVYYNNGVRFYLSPTGLQGNTGSLQSFNFTNSSGYRVGVNTSNNINTLDVSGAVAIGTSYAGLISAPTNGLIVQGNVGLGTSTPAYPLDIYSYTNTALRASTAYGNPAAMLSSGNGIAIEATGGGSGAIALYATVSSGSNPRATILVGQPTGMTADLTEWESSGGTTLSAIKYNGAFSVGTQNSANMLDVSGGVAIGSSYAGVNSSPTNGLIIQGNVGIGTSAPAATLDIAGYTRLAKYSSAPATCSSSNDGAVALTTKHTLCICNGSTWATIADGASACAWAGSSPVQIILSTAGCATWTVPANWNSTNNKIEAVGAGAGGASFNYTAAGSVGGSGGAYSATTNLALTAGATVNYCIGAGGNGETGSAAAQTGGDTWFNAATFASSSVAAKGGSAVSSGNTGGTGGAASSGIGSVKYSGGNGGNSGTDNAGAGGGGAAGPDGNGLSGTAGASGSSVAGGVGGNGDNGDGGTGGTGGTSSSKNGTAGNSGTYSGGGGGGGYSDNGNGGNGGSPGAGGGGGGSDSNSTIGGQGAAGEIVITYTP